ATAAEMAVALARLPLAAAVPVASRPSTGNLTIASAYSVAQPAPVAPASVPGVPATPNTPGPSPARLLSPFVATPALAGALPDPPPPAPPSPPASMPYPPPQAVPSYARSGVGPAPTTGTIATVSRTTETPATRPRHRIGLVLAAVGAVAFGATVVVVA